jgi:aminomethyltransferase
MTSSTLVLKTPLFSQHLSLGARMIDFAGYKLPAWYTTMKDEHLAVRQSAGIFDISHMGLLRLSGPTIAGDVQRLICTDVSKTQQGIMVYGMILNHVGFILDDVMVGLLGDDYLLVVNASNTHKILDWIAKELPTIQVEDLNTAAGFLAIQGPQAARLIDHALGTTLSQATRFSLTQVIINGTTCIALRTGYTGEDGFELIIPIPFIGAVWDKLLAVGIIPCGLACRDTLRIEAGLPLYGQELNETLTPYDTRYKWIVKLDKDFIGRDALVTYSTQPRLHVTVGLQLEDKLIARPHYEIEEGGEITSGTLSPCSGHSIALALVPACNSALGTEMHIHIRDKACKAHVVPLPFYKS